MRNSRITGVGRYLPEKIVTNDDLAKMMDTSDEWIRERSGIEERRFFELGKDTTANMGTRAARMALENAGLQPNDVDFIVFATLSPDYDFPGSGVLVQRELGIKEVGALDVRTQCTGFVYGISVADQFIKTGMYDTVLVIGSEIHSSGLDLTTRGRGVSVLFGDGAGAAVLQASEEKGIMSSHLHSEGKHAEELAVLDVGSSRSVPRVKPEMIEEGTIFPVMNGNFVFKHASTRFPQAVMEALNHNGYKPEDLDLLIPHQANLRISQMVQKQLKLRDDQVFNNIMKYGNTTAASIPIAMSEAWEQGKIKENDLICLAAFGSGFTWGSVLMRW
ncbi:3-oxoacyl-[acyl-carrier-protein] synthase-3 [Catalinimonas alkaloidigena]|uniref:3-oxoacyl-ACP synthase III family protein n=1 Tax=Catalinimonas alkaloidigena TaxID=1075417 RepID=UPI00240644EC|nr:beta-ketoacyl-ACP synthase III [Catalinimonas alkaloidigena]MDF9795485.1 3-oxoacyl-[acyl-carrier-protein] synthase-3 [Catalinimonas alkaloidigena]